MKDAVLASFSVHTILFRSIRVWADHSHLARGFSRTPSSVVSISPSSTFAVGCCARQASSLLPLFKGYSFAFHFFSSSGQDACSAYTGAVFFCCLMEPRALRGARRYIQVCIYTLAAFCGRTCGSQRFPSFCSFLFLRRLVEHVIFFHHFAEDTSTAVFLPI